MPTPPRLALETSLYADDLAAAEQFYGDVLGLDVMLRTEGNHITFRCGPGVVHVFDPAASRDRTSLPAHGAEGPVHVAFGVPTDQLAAWRRHFNRHDVAVEDTTQWGDGQRSLYVRDPAGNSVELVSNTLWSTTARAERLRRVRPVLDLDTAESRPVEQFQNETLRPILKLLNPTILRLVAERLARYGVGFAAMDRVDQRDRLRNLMKEDGRLKRTLLGMVVGHLTQDELDTYLAHKDEVRRRTVPMLLARAQDQIDDIAERVRTQAEGA
ncbi:catechol 2,3-dioxygenase-like lactoylglutathione lyase family enzyme [Salinibacter ruber]|uniref:VOC family protein n=1 Tax=Salinibacter ruber TaxID=146919 RepID=UPI0020742863|nr:VOC family protein [Salinibacter ruber]MCS3628812.1 catechol 2,3-dioxygenase-like lactoylglutathione lyase family enzyme [Salinibacter ruber]MCS3827022.1 catechol 2,3-dioxygenase-like lactoylglutathione lyase family enzyme [Salinibacter ruber]MCS4145721.1 catechol 2,3-dioxygenase-like lactoylglutathione lyase family enzyme [Salinibacter ruber]